MENITIPVKGMHCASCASNIERIIKKTDGVKACEVNFGTEKAELEYDPQKVRLEDLSKKIEPLGYSLAVAKDASAHFRHVMPDGSEMKGMDHSAHLGLNQTKEEKLLELERYKRKLEFVLPFTILVFLFMMWEIAASFWPNFPDFFLPEELYQKILLVVATPVMFWVGQPFIKGFTNFVRYHVANMDTLVGMGTLTAYVYSAVLVLFPQIRVWLGLPATVYFDVTIVVIGFIVLGKFLEIRSKLRTGEAIEKLMNLQTKTALVLVDGKEKEMPIEQVKVATKKVTKKARPLWLSKSSFS